MLKNYKDMAANRFKKEEKKQNGPNGRFAQHFSSMLDGSLLTRNTTANLMPFILYLTGLALFLIFNAYYAEKKARELDLIRREMTELRIRYINTKSQYMFLTNQSEITRRLGSRGFIEPTEPPRPVYDLSRNKNLLGRLIGN